MNRDLLLSTSVFVAIHFGLNAVDFAYAGPVAIMAAVSVIFWRQGWKTSTFQSLGINRPKHIWLTPLYALGTVIAAMLVVALTVRPLATALNLPETDLSGFSDIEGDPGRLAIMLLIAWTSAALGEEILFRGFLMQQLERLFGGGRIALACAVVGQALAFAIAHANQGPQGILQTGIVGLVLGVAFIVTGRNLWTVILAHGLINTNSLVAIYAGLASG